MIIKTSPKQKYSSRILHREQTWKFNRKIESCFRSSFKLILSYLSDRISSKMNIHFLVLTILLALCSIVFDTTEANCESISCFISRTICVIYYIQDAFYFCIFEPYFSFCLRLSTATATGTCAQNTGKSCSVCVSNFDVSYSSYILSF